MQFSYISHFRIMEMRALLSKGRPDQYYKRDIGQLVKKARSIKATGGKDCNQHTHQASKMRKNDGSLFVGAFSISNVRDVSPNVEEAFCTDIGKPCDFNHSSCSDSGPRYSDEILSTKTIGERQFKTTVELFESASEELTGDIDYRHAYLNFTDIEVELDNNEVVKS